MQIIDLSHPITQSMPVYPGSHPPELKTACTIEEHGYGVKNMLLNSHLGTHMDAPVHMVDTGKTLNQLPVDSFIGRGVLVDVASQNKDIIDIDDLRPFQNMIAQCDFVIIFSGWSRFWGQESYFHGYPTLTQKAAKWLTDYNLKGIGLDTVSIDTDNSQDYLNHKTVLGNTILVIENLSNLGSIPVNQFTFCCFPLNIEEGDGCPVRAVALIQ